MNRHRPIVLQIRPINIQARMQATRDAASCGKQIDIPSAVITAPCDASLNSLFAHDVIAVGLLSTADTDLQAIFPAFFHSIS